MRTALVKRPWTWAGIALGGALATAASFIWTSQLMERDARANVPDVAGSPIKTPDRSTRKAEKLSGAPANQTREQAQPGFLFQHYFDRNYYAYYFYSPPSKDWVSESRPETSPFTPASIGDVGELNQLPSLTLSAAVLRGLPDVSKLVSIPAASVSAPALPKGLLTNETPFHLFVTSDSISPASAEIFGSSTLAPASAAVSASSLTGAATGAVGTVNGTANSLLRR